MISIKNIIIILTTILFANCNNSSKKGTSSYLISLPLKETCLIDDLTPFIDSVQMIPLEAKEGAFITQIEKIILDSHQQIIILNSTGILQFDATGNFIRRIGKIGRGPGEYQKIYDICLDQTKEKLLALDYNNQVLQYSLTDGHFMQSIHPQLPKEYPTCAGIASGPNDGFFLFGCNPYNESNLDCKFYCLNQFNANGKNTGEFLLRKDYVLTPTVITQSYDNSYLIRPQTWDNICYRINKGQISPFMKIDFQEKTMPYRYIRFQPQEGFNLERFLFAPYYKLPIYIQETCNQLYFCCASPKEADNIFFLINKDSLKGIRWKVIGKSNPNLVIGKASDKDYFYYVFHDYGEYNELNLPADMDPLKKYLITQKNIKLEGEDCNPIIVKIKFNI